MKNELIKIALNAIERLAKASSETTSHFGAYQPKTPKDLQMPNVTERQKEH